MFVCESYPNILNDLTRNLHIRYDYISATGYRGCFSVGMRKPYKDAMEVFDLKDLTSNEPYGNFDQWFKLACDSPSILEANAMTLATATKYVHGIIVMKLESCK